MTERAYVVGDLHLGCGPGDPLEDFHDDAAFARFCERIAGGDTSLVLNGDIIDFPQIPPFDVPDARHLLWTEQTSRVKLAAALAGHRDFFAGLRRLVQRGSQVVCLIGNHDLDLWWPSVQVRLREAIGATGAQLRFALTERYRGVHIEHGFQFTAENCPRDPTSFVHPGPGGEPYLERIWGTDFMLQFYNQLEAEYPYADNVKPMLTLVWYGLKNRWIGAREIVRLLVFLKHRGVPWGALAGAARGELDELGQPLAELAPDRLADSFADPAWQAMLDERAREPRFAAELQDAASELGPDERARVLRPGTVETPSTRAADQPRALGLVHDDRERRAAYDRLTADGVTGVVFGHTHVVVDGALDGQLCNPGSWLPGLDLGSPVVKAKIAAHGLTKDMLADPGLYRVERCAVLLEPDPPTRTRMQIVSADDA